MELEKNENNNIKLDNHSIKKQKHSGSSEGLFHETSFDQTFSKSLTTIVIILSLIAILFFSVSSASAVDVTISNTTSTGINGSVNSVTSGGTVNNSITLNAGVYNKTVDRANTISFSNKNLSVRGNGAPSAVIIDGNNIGRLFTISGSNNNISFENITFRKGKDTQYGAAFYITGNSTVIFKNCIFTSNAVSSTTGSTSYGGAIYNTGSNITVNNSTFTNNNISVVYAGTGTSGYGGAIHSRLNLTVINSIFTNNGLTIRHNGTSSDGYGGVISSNGNLTLVGSTFTNNGITMIMNGTSGDGYGGAIYSTGNNSYITNSSFSNNYINSTNINAFSDSYGGVIYNSGNLNLSSSNFTNNRINVNGNASSSGSGGAIYNRGNLNLSSSNFTNIIVTGSGRTSGYGGVIYNSANFSLSSSNFTNNSMKVNGSSNYGGVIYNTGTTFSINSSNFANNGVNSSGSGSGSGGVIYNRGNFSSSSSNFANNGVNSSGYGYGGVIYNGGNFSSSSSNFTNNSMKVNGSYSYGGVIYNTGTTFSINSSNFANNGVNSSSSGYGGVIYNGGNFSLSSSNFTNNSMKVNGGYSYGGVIYNTGTTFSINSSNFANNVNSSGYGYGGVIYNGGNFSLSSSNFTNNGVNSSGSGYGGAIYNGGNFNLSNSSFINNSAGYGGAIYNGANFNLSNSSFINNSAGYGGGIYTGGNVVVSSSNFTNNTQAIGFITTNFTLNNTNISDNGIAIQFIYGNINYTLDNLTANGTIIKDNNYTYDIRGNNSNYVISQESVLDTAYQGFIIITGNNNTIINSNICNISNTAITINTTALRNTLINLTLSNNSLAIHFLGNNSVFTNGTLDGNEIGAIISGFNNTIIGTTIVNNTVVGVNITGSNNTLNYNRIYQNTLGMLNSGINTNANFNWWGKNNITNQYSNSGTNLNLTYWYVLQLSLNSTFNTTANATRNYTKNVPANLSYTLTLNNIATNTTNNPGLLPYFTVKILLKNSTSVVNNISDDIRTFTFSKEVMLSGTDLQGSIHALVDDENLILIIEDESNIQVNLTIVKVANVTNVSNNGTINFTIIIINNGNDIASNVTFTDLLNDNFKLLNVTGGSSYNNATGIWTVGDIEDKTNVTLNMIVQAIKSGTVNNTANNVTAIETLVNPNINSTVTITITPAVNLNITKISNVTGLNTSHIGDHVKYTITVKNNGLDNASNVKVHDILDSKLTYITHNSSTGTYNNTTGLWNIGTLNVNQTATLEIEVIIANIGTIENIANITANEIILNGSNTNTSTTIHVNPLNSTLIINPIVNTKINSNVSINGNLLDEKGAPISGVTINLTVNNVAYNATTDARGNWNISYFVGSTGNINVVAEFVGNVNYTGAANATYFDGLALNSTLIINHIVNTKINSSVNINGTLLDENGAPISGVTINLTVNGVAYNAATNAGGNWNINYHVGLTGRINVVAEFVGNVNYTGAANATYFDGLALNSTLIISHIVDAKVNSSVSINGTLLDENGAPIGGVIVNLTVNGVAYNVTTNAGGNWSITYHVGLTGRINVVAEFVGNVNYTGAANATYFDGLALNSTLIISHIVDAKVNSSVSINGTLFDEGGVPIGGVIVNLAVNGVTYNVTTKADGKWNITYHVISTGIINVVAEFVGNTNHTAAVNSTSFNGISLNSTLVINPVPGTKVNSSVSINGTLFGENGAPIGGVTINLTINNVAYNATTNASGNWNINYHLSLTGRINVVAEFVGNANHAGAANATYFDGLALNSTLVINHIVDVKVNSSVSINGTLFDENGAPIGGVTINLTINNVAYNATTDSSGNWSIIYLVNSNELVNVVAEFVGNAHYAAAVNTTYFNGVALNSTLIINPILDTKINSNVSINGTLFGENNSVIGNVSVVVAVNGVNYNAMTDASGKWSITYLVNSTGLFNVVAIFNGNTNHAAAVNKTSFNGVSLNSTLFINPVVDTKVNSSVSINGTLLDENNSVIGNVGVVVTVNGVSYNSITDASGKWSIIYLVNSTGLFNVVVEFNGNTVYAAAVNSTNFNSLALNSTLVINPVTNAKMNSNVNINGTLLDENNNAISNVKVVVTVNGVNYNSTTDASGKWNISYFVKSSGNINVVAEFNGNTVYAAAVNSTSFSGVSLNSTLVINPVVDTKVNSSVSINGSLFGEGNSAIGNVSVVVAVNGVSYNSTTDASGKWNISYFVKFPGNINVVAEFNGNTVYAAAVNSTNFDGLALNSILVINPVVDTKVNSSVSINGTLLGENNKVISNVSVVVAVNGVSYNSTTDASGKWNISYFVKSSGNINVVAEFNGNAVHVATVNSTIFNGLALNSTLVINTVTNANVGSNVNIKGTLLDENNKAISNVRVVVTVNGVSYNITTDASGNWNINYLVNSTGIINVVAAFDGNDKYVGAVNSTTFIVNNNVNISIVKIASINGINNSAKGHVGDTVIYTINVVNNGVIDATGVLVTEIIDSTKLKFNKASVTQGSYNNINGLWTIGGIVAGETVTLTINATIIAIGNISNSANVSASGNNTNSNNSSSVTIVSVAIPTQINTLNVIVAVDNSVKLESILKDSNGKPIDGKEIKFYVNGKIIGTAVTDVKGVAYFRYTPTKTGTLTYTSSFTDPTGVYGSSTSSSASTVTVTKDKITLATTLPTGSVGDKKTIKVKATNSEGKPVPNKTFTVYINGKKIGTYKTNSKGEFTIKTTLKGSNKLQIKFAGDSKYNKLSKTYTYIAKSKEKTITTIYYTKTKYNKTVTLKAKLTTNKGKALAGKYIKFYVAGKYVGKSKTNKKGIAIFEYNPKKK
ncbi:beta strand repeat-containing protein [Methanobrevibacter filiformis]|uniref:Big-1 domain-containing protein n=1 Tax=Methanobrevibacter filiformis TaxID=55758 RepID=A0A166AJB4_9EURY|nr:DUF11 domain-containing protein [Methanobrevibacter filiformis]KZX12102.1 hypothetical protein MBFIL_12320 [Methanobrevibacter filiformis]